MTRSRKVLLVMIALAVAADVLPTTRELFSWWWVKTNDRAHSYQQFVSDWPNGPHLAEAKQNFERCRRAEYTRAQIREAYAAMTQTNNPALVAYRRERLTRQDSFFWRKSSGANSAASYKEYLSRFPHGMHEAEARQKIEQLDPATPKSSGAAQS